MNFLLFQHRAAVGERTPAARSKRKERVLSESEEGSIWTPALEDRRGGFDPHLRAPHAGSRRRSTDDLAGDRGEKSPPAVVNIQRDASGSMARVQLAERAGVLAPPTFLAQQSDPVAFKLSIVVPVYNEELTVQRVLEALIDQAIPGDIEIIVVDDGSTDRTKEMLQASWHSSHVCIRHETNRGKGAAVRTGISRATGTHLLVFDADSEYDPADIPKLIAPILSGRAEVVYGVRVQGAGVMFPSLVNLIGNRLMTAAANLLYGSAISDLHTCLKLLPIPLLRLMPLEEEGFGLDTEVSAELLRRGFRPFEVPVSYVGRSIEEGKKIRLADAFHCLEVLIRVRLRGLTRYGIRDKSVVPRVTAASSAEAAVLPEVAHAVDM